MNMPLIDAHIHLDLYEPSDQIRILSELSKEGVESLVAVSMHLASCQENAVLSKQYPKQVYPAFGFHPEQPLPSASELDQLVQWIRERAGEVLAIGEIGLPYYMRTELEAKGNHLDLAPYIQMLDQMLALAKELDKPVILHAVYEDADIVCDRLEAHGIKRAHFHWFKGSSQTVQRMADRGYFISFTPDLLYEEEIVGLARLYPAHQVMVETDGPWPFEGPFLGQLTHPAMIRAVAKVWADIQGLDKAEACDILYRNTKRFYGL
ncbi:TatD family hydrolase [Paenibacillus shirakamiensis]|nr:TatD family hydrolase [Paenibacillus shirakamiensis]